jgi:hypothetical protein
MTRIAELFKGAGSRLADRLCQFLDRQRGQWSDRQAQLRLGGVDCDSRHRYADEYTHVTQSPKVGTQLTAHLRLIACVD